MVNFIWLLLIGCSVFFGFIHGSSAQVVAAIPLSANKAITLAIGLIGVLSFWMGLMRVAEQAGLVACLSRILQKIITPLFPEVPANHPAMGAILLNMSANMFGLGNAATPAGIKAMEYLQELNDKKTVASNAMCTFLAINTSSVQLVPTGAMAVLVASGATNPSVIVFPALLATLVTTAVAIIAVKVFERRATVQEVGNESC